MAKVLLVDADWDNLVLLQKVLTAAGHQVSVALSGSFALTMIEWDRPDLVVSLAEIQDMDAYELCAIMRADPTTRTIPFLLLTGPEGPPPGAAARAGISRVIAGHFSVQTLVSQVRDLLGLPAIGRPDPSPPAAPRSETAGAGSGGGERPSRAAWRSTRPDLPAAGGPARAEAARGDGEAENGVPPRPGAAPG